MIRKYYKSSRHPGKIFRKGIRLSGLSIFILGLLGIIYIFFPLISWQIYFGPVFASGDIKTPIPRISLVTKDSIGSFIYQASSKLSGTDYTRADNWFPEFSPKSLRQKKRQLPSYTLSIPKINIQNATVTTEDTNLTKHLVNYPGTAVPPESGNAVIFGHSTLPQLFNSKDYTTIFANLYQLKVGDIIQISANNVSYKYIVYNISVVDPGNTQALAQNYDNSYLTLVTCTPPGTIWKRLIIKTRIEKI